MIEVFAHASFCRHTKAVGWAARIIRGSEHVTIGRRASIDHGELVAGLLAIAGSLIAITERRVAPGTEIEINGDDLGALAVIAGTIPGVEISPHGQPIAPARRTREILKWCKPLQTIERLVLDYDLRLILRRVHRQEIDQLRTHYMRACSAAARGQMRRQRAELLAGVDTDLEPANVPSYSRRSP